MNYRKNTANDAQVMLAKLSAAAAAASLPGFEIVEYKTARSTKETEQNDEHKARHLFSMLQTGFTTCQVAFGSEDRTYTYKVPNDWDVKAGDTLVVDSPKNGLVTVTVMGVDEVPRIDRTRPWFYKWAVSKVNVNEYEARVAAEDNFVKLSKQAKAMQHRRAALSEFNELFENSDPRLVKLARQSIGMHDLEQTAKVVAGPAPATQASTEPVSVCDCGCGGVKGANNE